MSLPRATLFDKLPKNTDSKETPAIRLFLDFDGTLTGRPGRETVSSDLYKSLQKNREAFYSGAEFIEFKDMIVTLQKGLEKNKDMKLVEGALCFLKTMLEYNAEIVIISRNRQEYIKAVLQAEGADEKEIAKIRIEDTNTKIGNKLQVVASFLKNASSKADVIVVCDDALDDFFKMKQAVTEAGLSATLIAYGPTDDYFKQNRRFDWAAITKEITQKIKPDSHPRPNV